MSLQAGQRLGVYELEAPLGAGGMGEVYRARDTRLRRTVAIKVLPEELAADGERRHRFEREARLISRLAHPHICVLHDVGEADGRLFLVMEHLAGESLARRLRRGALPPSQLLRVGAEIADALAHAHHQGIVHRDLKPANVMLTPGGAKLLDFGLGKPVPTDGETLGTEASTLSQSLTETGVALGTLQYMSPEQVEGRPVDARSDVFALGAVLFEMATGQRAFAGGNRSALAAAILAHEPPPVSALQPLAPAALDHVIRVCLSKEPEHRWQDAGDVAEQLRWLQHAPAQNGSAATTVARRSRRGAALAAAMATAALAAALLLLARESTAPPAPTPLRAALTLADGGGELILDSLALAPDGHALAFAALDGDELRLFVRPLREDEPRALAGTEGASFPFWSPDSAALAFFAGGRLKRVPSQGGAVQVVCEARDPRGGTWSVDDVIVFAAASGTGLHRVPASGGMPQPLTKPASATTSHRWPRFLPDGKHVLFTIGHDPSGADGVYLLTLAGGTRRRLLDQEVDAHFAGGRLLYYRDGNLLAQRFDPLRGALHGPPEVVAEGVDFYAARRRVRATASDRLLAYVAAGDRETILTWLDRRGGELGTVGAAARWGGVTLSPDGTRAVVFRDSELGPQPWLVDLARGEFQPLRPFVANFGLTAWSPSGDHVALVRRSPRGDFDLLTVAVDEPSGERVVDHGRAWMAAPSWSQDGQTIVYVRGADLWMVAADGSSPARPLVASPAYEHYPALSPDGRWLAFSSNESGRFELWVADFPDLRGKRQLSFGGIDGGTEWAERGRALYYFEGALHVRRLAVEDRDGRTHFGAPEAIRGGRPLGDLIGADFTDDGQRILATRRRQKGPPVVRLVVDWPALLAN